MFTKRSHLLNTHYINNNNNNNNGNGKCVHNHAQCMDAVSFTFLKTYIKICNNLCVILLLLL